MGVWNRSRNMLSGGSGTVERSGLVRGNSRLFLDVGLIGQVALHSLIYSSQHGVLMEQSRRSDETVKTEGIVPWIWSDQDRQSSTACHGYLHSNKPPVPSYPQSSFVPPQSTDPYHSQSFAVSPTAAFHTAHTNPHQSSP